MSAAARRRSYTVEDERRAAEAVAAVEAFQAALRQLVAEGGHHWPECLERLPRLTPYQSALWCVSMRWGRR